MTPEELAAIAHDLVSDESVRADIANTSAPDIEGYRLERVLGSGGSSTVYLASRVPGGDPVAIKVVTASRSSDALRHAEREARILESIDSTHTPRVFEVIELASGVAIVSEFIEGLHIDQFAAHHELGTAQRVALLADAADAAAACHEMGLVHRDLKPSNILVKEDGTPVIIDFGIATQIRPDPRHTRSAFTQGAGTPAFMPPEQADASLGQLSSRSDVWALGAIGYVLLTGEPPHHFDRSSPLANLRRIMEDPPRPPRSIDADLPRTLAAILLKACDRAPARRYANASELARDLRRWLQGDPITAQEPGPWIRATRWAGRHPVATTAAACLLLITTTLAGTLGLLHALLQRPYGFEIAPGGHEVYLVSRSGARLATIAESEWEQSKLTASRVETADGRWLVAVCAPHENPRLMKTSVWDPRDLSAPAWTAPDPGPFPPLEEQCYDDDTDQSSHAYIDRLIVADVFDELPGEEVIVFSAGTSYCPSALRVFDAGGNLLYKIWIAGSTGIYWHEGMRTVIYAGANNRLPAPNASETRNPQIVASIRPTLGEEHAFERWLTWGIEGSETNAELCLELVQPATHTIRHSPNAVDDFMFNAKARTPTGNYSVKDHVDIYLNVDLEDASNANLRVTLNNDFQQTGEVIVSNALIGLKGPHALVENLWGTDAFRFRECSPFDPNRVATDHP